MDLVTKRVTVWLLQQAMLSWELRGMVDWVQIAERLRLKILLPIVCITATAAFIYMKTRPPEPARIAPGAIPEFGRNAARQQAEASPLLTEPSGGEQ